MPNVGPSTVESLRKYLNVQGHLDLIANMTAAGVAPAPETAVQTNAMFTGKTFVVTGSMVTMDRKAIEDAIEGMGGKTSGSVSKKTSTVIAGPGAGSKLATAQSLGIDVWDEATFLQHANLAPAAASTALTPAVDDTATSEGPSL